MNDPNGLISPDYRSRLRQRIGGYSRALRWYRRLRPDWLWRLTSPLGAATAKYVKENDLVVRRGPFEGMLFPPAAVGASGFLPAKLLGCYEEEVLGALGSFSAVDTFVDLGSGDGYYPVGMRRRFPDAAVVGFESDAGDRELAARLAAVNGVSVDVRGTADADSLNGVLPGSGTALLLCDIEGAEREVLDPGVVPRLRDTHLVVELHPHLVADVEAVLTERFRASHAIEIVHGRDRSADLPELRSWPPQEANYAITDGRRRHGIWMVAVPQATDGGT
jgi:hypothetical protein